MDHSIESIEEDLIKVSKTLTLSHKVILGSKGFNNERIPFVKFFDYDNSKYKDISKLVAAKINKQDIFCIRYTGMDNIPNKANLKINFTINNIYKVCDTFNTLYMWFRSEAFKDLFIYKNEMVESINPKFSSLFLELYTNVNTSFNVNLMRVRPHVLSVDDGTNEKYPGVQVFFTNENIFVGNLTLDDISAILYFLKNYNMTLTGDTLINTVLLSKIRADTVKLSKLCSPKVS